jgi:hypothetical protein
MSDQRQEAKVSENPTRPNIKVLISTVKWALHLEQKLAEAREEIQDWKASFDLYDAAEQRARELWQAGHPGQEMTWPDKGKMTAWLLEQLAAMQAELIKHRKYSLEYWESSSRQAQEDEAEIASLQQKLVESNAEAEKWRKHTYSNYLWSELQDERAHADRLATCLLDIRNSINAVGVDSTRDASIKDTATRLLEAHAERRRGG